MAGTSFVNADDTSKKAHNQNQTALATVDPDVIEGKDVVDNTGKQLGDVNEVVQGKAGEKMAVIGLEDSAKEVAISLDKLKMSADGEDLVVMLDRAQLEALPDYDPMDLESVDE